MERLLNYCLEINYCYLYYNIFISYFHLASRSSFRELNSDNLFKLRLSMNIFVGRLRMNVRIQHLQPLNTFNLQLTE